MAQFPNSPGAARLAEIEPGLITLPAGTALARVYSTSSGHQQAWNEFRSSGPLNFRWDHQPPGAASEPSEQRQQVYYAAANAVTCLAEAFQATRRIDRVYQAPWLVVFKTRRPLLLLDLTGDFATRMGASIAIHSGSRVRARAWTRDLYAAFGDAEGIRYASVSHDGAPAFALNERALRAPFFPPHPEFHRALADDMLLDPLKHAAQLLGYALR
jgi:hypothetical protein